MGIASRVFPFCVLPFAFCLVLLIVSGKDLLEFINDFNGGATIKGMLCHVNLIPLNPTRGYDGSESNRDRIKRFREILTSNGIPNTLRLRRGTDINAGCGQLANVESGG